MTQIRFTFLGTGGSMGIPVLACECDVCHSTNPKNRRLRSSALIEYNGKNFLIDAGPDVREQLLNQQVKQIDGMILTHAHQDHTGGIDEMRVFTMWTKKPIPCLASQETAHDIIERFPYIFQNPPQAYALKPKFLIQYFEEERGNIRFEGVEFQYFTFYQAKMPVNGIRIGSFAYVSDIKTYPESIFEDLKGVEILVVSALRWDSTPLHFSVPEAIAFSEKLGVKETWLTHISHNLEHEETNKSLPPNVRMAYDGLSITFER